MLQLSAPSHKIKTAILLAGSKSISNRLLILRQVLGNPSLVLHNLSDSEDTRILVKAIGQITNNDSAIIDVGHGGTDMRFLTAFLSIRKGTWILTGSERMKQRPIRDLAEALKKLGAEINYLEKEGFPPLEIRGRELSGGSVAINSSVSSQFISALLLISPAFEKGLELTLTGTVVSRPYIEMTMELLKQAGVKVNSSADKIQIHPYDKSKNALSDFVVESDWSSASYWYSICALSPGSEIKLSSLNAQSLQADSVLPELFKQLGVTTSWNEETVQLSNSGNRIQEFVCDFTACPDIAQTIAVTCFALGIKTKLIGLSTLKVKETDRIMALKNEIEKFGVPVEVATDSIIIPQNRIFRENKPFLPNFHIHTYHDHRMAMSFAPLSLLCEQLKIEDHEVVNKSYPDFWKDLKSAGFSVNLQP